MKLLLLVCSDAGIEPPQEIRNGTVIARPGVCTRPEIITECIAETHADRLALGLCRDRYSLAEVQAAAQRSGIDPLGIPIVNLSDSSARPEVAMVAAAARALSYAGSGPDHVKLRRAPKIGRRSLLRGVLFEYVGVPSVDPGTCAAPRGCRACVDICPQAAIRIEDGLAVHDPAACIACGLCVTACPTGATVNPAFTPQMLEAELRVLLRRDGGSSPGIAFVCLHDPEPAMHEKWRPVSVPCVGMLPAHWLIATLLMGARAVAVVPCGSVTGGLATGSVSAAREVIKAAGLPESPVQLIDDLSEPPQGTKLRRMRVRSPFSHDGAPRVMTSLSEATQTSFRVEHLNVGLGLIELGPSCTVCGACASACPTAALAYEYGASDASVSFDAEACIACSRCLTACPEREQGAIHLTTAADTNRLGQGRAVLRTDGIVNCSSCGTPFAPQLLVDRILLLIGENGADSPRWATLCSDCRSLQSTTLTSQLEGEVSTKESI